MNTPASKVFLVDDDPAVLKALRRLLRAAGFEVCAYASAPAFLEEHDAAAPGCAVVDLAMPGLTGLELQRVLASSGCERPIVFITGRGDIPASVQAMKAGAVDFLTKPFDDKVLLSAIRAALEKDQRARQLRTNLQLVEQRLARLTPREREVLTHIVAGQLNKQIAAVLGTVEKTIKVHRARVMEKMEAKSLADLVRMAERVGVATSDSHARI
jgi:FixJ family two-component response regulator